MNVPGLPSDLPIAYAGRATAHDLHPARHFVGLQRCPRCATIYGALVRVWGRGLTAVVDSVAGSRCRHGRIGIDVATSRVGDAALSPTELAERAAQTVAPLLQRLPADDTSPRAIGLLDFGLWQSDALGVATYQARCDTAMLAALSGLTVIDDLPARDLAHGGRGGPCEAAGAWLLLSDRGIMPGRVIRALVDLDHTARLFLLPPRQSVQLPPQLACYELGPALSLLDGIVAQLTLGGTPFDPSENRAVQGRRIPELYDRWRCLSAPRPATWTPHGVDARPLLQVLQEWPASLATRLPDVLCTAIHWVADQISDCVKHQLPRGMPVGQLILGGPVGKHPFLMRQIRQQLPEVEVVALEDRVAATRSWRAVAAAVLAMLHVDQVPANSPALTGAQAPRLLGRITPGTPGNWHRVLSDMALTLPDKVTLRSAV